MLFLTSLVAHGCATKTINAPIGPDAKPLESSSKSKVHFGAASWYGPGFHGKLTASGEVFDENRFTAAHKTLPLGSRVRVTNLENGSAVEVAINDRGPFVDGRIIDLSKAAAKTLGIIDDGIARVKLELIDDAMQNRSAAGSHR